MGKKNGVFMTGSVCYVMPSLYPSGGNKMIVEHVKRLAKRGHFAAVSVVLDYKEADRKWLDFYGLKIEPFTKDALEKYEHVVATYWETYYHIKNLCLSGPKLSYFVQSKEEDFEGDTVRKLKVISSLMDKDVQLFTEAKWIQLYLRETCGKGSLLVPNHIELPDGLSFQSKGNKPVVLIEGEATASWKNIAFGARVAQLLRPEFEVWLLTSTPYSKLSPLILGSFDQIFSGVQWKEALELIMTADVVYRPSILEGFNGCMAEAMALGTPFVGNKIPGNYEACVNEWNSLLVEPGKLFDAVGAIRRLYFDIELREKIKRNAYKTAESFTNWDKSIDILVDTVFCLG